MGEWEVQLYKSPDEQSTYRSVVVSASSKEEAKEEAVRKQKSGGSDYIYPARVTRRGSRADALRDCADRVDALGRRFDSFARERGDAERATMKVAADLYYGNLNPSQILRWAKQNKYDEAEAKKLVEMVRKVGGMSKEERKALW